MAHAFKMLAGRHIQNMSEAKILEPHWGYADRALPCTNDKGSCEYLDVVYHSHDLGMLYSGIIYATIGAVLFVWIIARLVLKPSSAQSSIFLLSTEQASQPRSAIDRFQRSLRSLSRKWLLPESIRSIFGRTTRLQVLTLTILVGYLTIWSFVGIVWKIWITPVKNSTLHNTRSSLGPWSDRIGVLAFAMIPFSVLLSSRESILSLLTGIPYQHFNFIHRWLGYLIFIQSALHTIGWTIIEVKLYQPQPKVARAWITQKYMIWGIVAQILLTAVFVLSLKPVVRRTGYEFFRKAHYVFVMLFIGACWGHWQQLKCFLLPSLLLWFLDRGARLFRTWLTHYNYLPDGSMGFQNAKAHVTRFPDDHNGDIVRLDFEYPHNAWKVGQHFYLCFPELSIWQSHPFTPCSLPQQSSGYQSHSYLIRSKKGQTKNLAALAAARSESKNTPVILTGPYGENTLSKLDRNTNVLCIAGGTGITYVLPVLLHLANQPDSADRHVELIWAVRRNTDTEWIQHELQTLRTSSKFQNIKIRIFVTREDATSTHNPETKEMTSKINQVPSSSSSSTSITSQKDAPVTREIENPSSRRPDLRNRVLDFVNTTVVGPSVVYASGPGTMISDLRDIVASCNDGSRVWRGDEKFDVGLVCDDRLEW